jgi:hypothetical protein
LGHVGLQGGEELLRSANGCEFGIIILGIEKVLDDDYRHREALALRAMGFAAEPSFEPTMLTATHAYSFTVD